MTEWQTTFTLLELLSDTKIITVRGYLDLAYHVAVVRVVQSYQAPVTWTRDTPVPYISLFHDCSDLCADTPALKRDHWPLSLSWPCRLRRAGQGTCRLSAERRGRCCRGGTGYWCSGSPSASGRPRPPGGDSGPRAPRCWYSQDTERDNNQPRGYSGYS